LSYRPTDTPHYFFGLTSPIISGRSPN